MRKKICFHNSQVCQIQQFPAWHFFKYFIMSCRQEVGFDSVAPLWLRQKPSMQFPVARAAERHNQSHLFIPIIYCFCVRVLCWVPGAVGRQNDANQHVFRPLGAYNLVGEIECIQVNCPFQRESVKCHRRQSSMGNTLGSQLQNQARPEEADVDSLTGIGVA